jgi:hypothetical protein
LETIRGIVSALNGVPQDPNGASITRRSPQGGHPRCRVGFVFTQVSSIKTTRSGCFDTAGIRCLNPSSRCRVSLARRRSVATSDFYMCSPACEETCQWHWGARTPVASNRTAPNSGIVTSPSRAMISANKAQCGSSLPLPLSGGPEGRLPPDLSDGSQAPIAPPWPARSSRLIRPPDRLTLPQCIAETAHEAHMAMVLT